MGFWGEKKSSVIIVDRKIEALDTCSFEMVRKTASRKGGLHYCVVHPVLSKNLMIWFKTWSTVWLLLDQKYPKWMCREDFLLWYYYLNRFNKYCQRICHGCFPVKNVQKSTLTIYSNSMETGIKKKKKSTRVIEYMKIRANTQTMCKHQAGCMSIGLLGPECVVSCENDNEEFIFTE